MFSRPSQTAAASTSTVTQEEACNSTIAQAHRTGSSCPPLCLQDFVPQLCQTNGFLPETLNFTNVHKLTFPNPKHCKEDLFIVAQLVHIRAASDDMSIPISYTNSSLASRGSGSIFSRYKKLKTSYTYRRMFFFYDLCTAGRCFVIFETGHNEEKMYWQDVTGRAKARVGDFFLISEPNTIETELKGGLSIVRTTAPFILIKRPPNLTDYIAATPNIDTFTGFNISGVKIQLCSIQCIDTNCQGSFCDRLFPTISSCGCYSQARTQYAKHVFSFDIAFDSGTAFGEETTAKCSSLRFSELFFTQPIPSSIIRSTHVTPKLRQLRESFRALCDYVNNNNAWDIAGWSRPSHGIDNIANDIVSKEVYGFHVSYIHPTNNNILNLQEFKNLQIDTTTFFFDQLGFRWFILVIECIFV